MARVSGVTVRIRRGVAAFEANLMRAHALRLEEESAVQFHAASGFHIHLHHPAPDTVGVELLVPRRVEPVGEVEALAVAADFHHLRAAVQRLRRLARMCRTAEDAAEPNRA